MYSLYIVLFVATERNQNTCRRASLNRERGMSVLPLTAARGHLQHTTVLYTEQCVCRLPMLLAQGFVSDSRPLNCQLAISVWLAVSRMVYTPAQHQRWLVAGWKSFPLQLCGRLHLAASAVPLVSSSDAFYKSCYLFSKRIS
jgi:hypothetical protein